MACNPSPTLTEFATVTSIGSSVSSSPSVSTADPTVTTIVTESCAETAPASGSVSASCASTTTITSVSTIAAGGPVTIQVPITVTFSVTETQPTLTLFATCSDTSTPASQPPPSSSSSSPQQPSPSTPTTASIPTTNPVTNPTPIPISTTPNATTLFPASSTLADGSIVFFTITSTIPGSSIALPSNSSTPGQSQVASPGDGGSTNLAAIIGGVVGGFVGLIAIVGAIWFFLRRRQSWDDLFEKELDNDDGLPPVAARPAKNRRLLDLRDEPKPYQYGLVGHVPAPTATDTSYSGSAGSPPTSSHSHAALMTAAADPTGRRRTSLVPVGGAAPLQTSAQSHLVPATATSSSRPSTAGSTQNLLSAQNQMQIQNQNPSYTQNQNSNTRRADEFGAAGGPTSVPAPRPVSRSSPSPAQLPPGAGHAHSPSGASTSNSLSGPVWNPNVDLVALDAGGRAGSPVSVCEGGGAAQGRRLQLVNADPGTGDGRASLDVGAGRPAEGHGSGKLELTYEIGREGREVLVHTDGGRIGGTGSGSGSGSGSPTQVPAQGRGQVQGRGRDGKVLLTYDVGTEGREVLVHHDAGRFGGGSTSPSPSAGGSGRETRGAPVGNSGTAPSSSGPSAPPAYSER